MSSEQRTLLLYSLPIVLLPFLPNVQVSDTTGDATYAIAGYKKYHDTFSQFFELIRKAISYAVV